MSYTVIKMSEEQVNKMYKKHCKPGIFKKSIKYSYDDEDDIGFVELKTRTNKKISYQFRRSEPMFIEFFGFNNIRYDLSYPKKINKELYEFLKRYGALAEKNFWKGGQI